jgi:hypothetical protein
MSPAVEARILAAVDTVTDAVADGLSPTAAVVKAATAHSLAPPQVRLLSQAYNTGVTGSIRKAATDARARAASAPLADAAEAIKALFPDSPATPAAVKAAAVSPAYRAAVPAAVLGRLAAPMAKVAAAPAYAPVSAAAVLNACDAAARELSQLWRTATAANLKMAAAVDAVEAHFQSPDCLSPHLLRTAAVSRFGDDADVVMDAIHLSRRAALVKASGAVDWGRPPFRDMATVMAAGGELATARMAAAAFDREAGEKLAGLVDAVRGPVRDRSLTAGLPVPTEVSIDAARRRLTGTDKRASGAMDVAKGLTVGTLLSNVYKGLPTEDSAESAKAKAFAKLTDPVHEARMDTMRRKFMLTNLMANDPVIKGYKPKEVLQVYNQMTQLAPRASSQEMLVQALLRRHLSQGQVDPHEVDQLVGIEGKLKQNDDPLDSRKLPDRLPYVVNRPADRPADRSPPKDAK